MGDGEKIRILMAEDSADDAELILREISRGGFAPECTRVETEEDFRSALDEQGWDIILSDYAMEGFWGTDALRLFKEKELLIPFILISGTIGEETAVEAMRLGASDYIMKDNLKRLVPAIQRELHDYGIIREERRQSRELQEIQEQFEAVFRTSTDGISIADFEDGTLLQVNDEYCRLFGYSRHELIGKNTVDLGIWKSSEERDVLLEILRYQKLVRNYEVTLGTATSRSMDILLSSEIVNISGKKFILSFLRDVSYIKAAERAIQRSESRYRNILDNINQVIFSFNRYGIVIYVSPNIERLAGYTVDQVVGSHVLKFVFSGDIEKIRNAFEKVFKIGRLKEIFVFRLKCYDGTTRWVRVSASLYRETGEGEELLGGILSDMTELKAREEEIREAYKKLHTLVEAIPDPVYLKDRESRLVLMNSALEKSLGRKRRELVGKRATDFMPEDLAEKSRKSDREVLETGTETRVMNTFITRDNDTLYVDTHKVALLNEEGRAEGIIGVCRNITDIKKAEQQYRNALNGAIMTISRIVEIRDPYTAGHQTRASEISVEIAREMELESERIEAIRVASLLYEVGKIEVPSEILNKPGKLNSMELELVRGHAVTGAEILSNIDFPWPIAEIVAQHHERMDGSGYPQGLKNEDIRIEARILGVADVLEAMCAHRPYRPSLGMGQALEELENKRGILYDPKVVDAALRLYRERG